MLNILQVILKRGVEFNFIILKDVCGAYAFGFVLDERDTEVVVLNICCNIVNFYYKH